MTAAIAVKQTLQNWGGLGVSGGVLAGVVLAIQTGIIPTTQDVHESFVSKKEYDREYSRIERRLDRIEDKIDRILQVRSRSIRP